MTSPAERLGDGTDVVVTVRTQRALALAVFVDEPEQAERTGLVGKFMPDIGLKMRRAVGGESRRTASVTMFFVVPPNPRSLVTSYRVNDCRDNRARSRRPLDHGLHVLVVGAEDGFSRFVHWH